MRRGIHLMPQGVRGFGVNLLMQGDGNHTNLVFLLGCCRKFIDEFFILLFTSLFPDDIRS